MAKGRAQTWIAVILVGAGLLIFGIGGLWTYMGATAKRLHPDPSQVPAAVNTAPVGVWAGAVERGRQVVRASLAEQNLPGVSVAVGVGGEVAWAEGFGYADLESQEPVTPSDRFRMGTASTVLTSVAAGLLLEEGKLRLDDEIQRYVPEFPKKQWPVRVRQLMGHVAGVKNDGGDEGPLFSEHCGKPAEAVRHFGDSVLLFEPGTQFKYSSYGWILMSAAVEAAAGRPFLEYVKQRVFDPLGMRDTGADESKNPIPDGVTVYFPRFMARPEYGLHLMRDLDYSCYSGASVFVSTPSDLARFGMAVNGGKVLKRETVQLLQTTQRLARGGETGYGLGWDVETVTLGGRPVRAVGHDGEVLGGMAGSLVTLPERGMAVAVMSNISYADTHSLAVKIAEAFAEHGRAAGK